MPIDSASRRWPFAFRPLQEPPELREPAPLACRVDFLGGQAHQAAQPEPRQLRDRVRKRGESRWRDAGLRRLAAEVDLDAHVERRQRLGALRGEPLRDPDPVHRVDPVEVLRGLARLVGLQRADEVAAEAATGQRVRSASALPAGSFLRGRRARHPARTSSRSSGCDLATPIRVMSAGSRPAARAATVMRSRTAGEAGSRILRNS